VREKELRESSICANCGKPFGHTQLPIFFRVTIEQLGVDIEAIRRQDGLAALLGGSSAIAMVMGADEEMTKPLREPVTVTLCYDCAVSPVCVLELLYDQNEKAIAG
jgi:hypothetical protein